MCDDVLVHFEWSFFSRGNQSAPIRVIYLYRSDCLLNLNYLFYQEWNRQKKITENYFQQVVLLKTSKRQMNVYPARIRLSLSLNNTVYKSLPCFYTKSIRINLPRQLSTIYVLPFLPTFFLLLPQQFHFIYRTFTKKNMQTRVHRQHKLRKEIN